MAGQSTSTVTSTTTSSSQRQNTGGFRYNTQMSPWLVNALNTGDTSTPQPTATTPTTTAAPQTQEQPQEQGQVQVQQQPVQLSSTYNAEALATYNREHPAPQHTRVVMPEYSNPYSNYDAILKEYEPKEPDAKAMKRRRANQTIAAIGDGLSAIANLVGTTKGGLNVYDPKNSLSARLQDKYAKQDAALAQARETYMKLRKQAADARDKEYQANLDKAKIMQNSADEQYKTDVEQHKAGQTAAMTAADRDQAQGNANRKHNFDVDNEQWRRDMEENKFAFDKQMGIEDKNIRYAGIKVDQENAETNRRSVNQREPDPDYLAGSAGHFQRNRGSLNANSQLSVILKLRDVGALDKTDSSGNIIDYSRGLQNPVAAARNQYFANLVNKALNNKKFGAAAGRELKRFGYIRQEDQRPRRRK